MKLISLNTWGGKIYQPLMDFIKENSNNTDIFCLQEVFSTPLNIQVLGERRTNLYEEMVKILKDYNGFFHPQIKNHIIGSRVKADQVNFELYFGLAIFVKKNVEVTSYGDFFTYGKRYIFDPNNLNTLPRNTNYITFTKEGKQFTVCNLHGIWLKEGKKDSPERLKQSEIIKDFLNKQQGAKILVGDFNLDINTESIKILEEDLVNLIKKYNVSTTRNKYFPGEDKFADYTFISPDIKVGDFQIPNITVSDHLPLVLQFS